MMRRVLTVGDFSARVLAVKPWPHRRRVSGRTMLAESRPHPLRLSAMENGPPGTVRMRPTEDTDKPATDGGACGAPLTRPQRGGGTNVAPVAAPTGSSSGRADAQATTMHDKQRAFFDAGRIVGSRHAWS